MAQQLLVHLNISDNFGFASMFSDEQSVVNSLTAVNVFMISFWKTISFEE